MLDDDAFSGIWIAVIGWFLQAAGAAQLRQVRFEHRLTGLCVRDIMRPDTYGPRHRWPKRWRPCSGVTSRIGVLSRADIVRQIQLREALHLG